MEQFAGEGCNNDPGKAWNRLDQLSGFNDAGTAVKFCQITVHKNSFPVKNGDKKTPSKPNAVKIKDAELSDIENELSSKLGAKVQINTAKNGKGKIIISYKNLSELESLLEKFEG